MSRQFTLFLALVACVVIATGNAASVRRQQTKQETTRTGESVSRLCLLRPRPEQVLVIRGTSDTPPPHLLTAPSLE